MSARERARDAQRKSDLDQLQKALEMYKMDQTPPQYPASLNLTTSCGSVFQSGSGEVYMKEVPCDPKNSGNYIYAYGRGADTLTYTLTACLENKSDPDGKTGVGSCPNLGIRKTEP